MHKTLLHIPDNIKQYAILFDHQFYIVDAKNSEELNKHN